MISKLLRKSGFKIGVLVASLTVAMFMILNFMVLQKSEESFIKVVEQTISEELENREEFMFGGPRGGILRFTLEGIERLQPLQEEFTQDFQSSVLRMGLLSIFVSFIIGYAASSIFTRPLEKLTKEMKKLRQNNYQVDIEKTNTEEFDNVLKEFSLLAKELGRVEELRKDLISDTSHELKTPLTALKAQLEGVSEGVLKMDKKRAENLLEQVERLNSLVETLQEYTRLRNKTYELSIKPIMLAKIVKKIASSKKKSLKKSKIILHVDIPSKLRIDAETHLISQVIENLIDNALSYSKAKNLYISATSKGIIVEDDGVGVSKKHYQDIFERFFRVEKSRNRKTGGLGLGLAIVREIVEAHGWRIEAHKSGHGGLSIEISFS